MPGVEQMRNAQNARAEDPHFANAYIIGSSGSTMHLDMHHISGYSAVIGPGKSGDDGISQLPRPRFDHELAQTEILDDAFLFI